MSRIRFSESAKTDLLSIGAYTIETWGVVQAARYLDELDRCAEMLARNPRLGRACGWIRPGLHRFEKGRHVVFYRLEADGILVSRILHQSMLPQEERFEDTQPEND
jgi:toxin ParE1/3/4